MTTLALTPAEQAYQSFVQAARGWWAGPLYREMSAPGPERAAEAYRVFCGLEGALQDLKYTGTGGLVGAAARQRDELTAALAAPPAGAATLELDPGLELPGYFTAVPFHHQPGGTTASPVAGFVYEHASGSTTRMTDPASDMHARFAARAADLVAAGGRVLDLGCGFGKSTVALARALPGAEITGVDLSEPLLRLALLRARELGLPLRYRQGRVEALPWPDASFDLVTASMVIHEMPPAAMRRALAEAARVLRPGGTLLCLDFYVLAEHDLAEALHRGHSRRNEEPYLEQLFDLDLPAELSAAGFGEVAIEASAQRPGMDEWSLPWTFVTATRPRSGP